SFKSHTYRRGGTADCDRSNTTTAVPAAASTTAGTATTAAESVGSSSATGFTVNSTVNPVKSTSAGNVNTIRTSSPRAQPINAPSTVHSFTVVVVTTVTA